MKKNRRLFTLFTMFIISIITAIGGFLCSALAEEKDSGVIGGDSFLEYTLSDNYKNINMPVSEYVKKSVNSAQPGNQYALDNMFDGKLNTKWESQWGNNLEKQFNFTFKENLLITGFRYITRLDNNIGGTPSYFTFQTSSNGIDYIDVEKVNVEYKLGTHTYNFKNSFFTKYLRVLTNADALTEYYTLFIPSNDNKISLMINECDKYIAEAKNSQGLQSGAYRPNDVKSFETELDRIKLIELKDDDTRKEKATLLFNLAKNIKRSLLVSSNSLSDSINQAKILLDSCIVNETEPLKWTQENKNKLQNVYDKATNIADVGDNHLGEVNDVKYELENAIDNFKKSSNKPEITSSSNKFNGASLMDGLTESRVTFNKGNEGNVSFVFDYKNEAQFINFTMGSWWASSQGVAKFKLEYLDSTSNSFKTVDGGQNGLFTSSWVTNTSKTEFITFKFKPLKTSKMKFTIMPGYNYPSGYICIDEIMFGIDVLPEDVIISVTPESITLTEGEKIKLECTVLPFYTPNKSVEFISENEDIATVDSNGMVLARSVVKGEEESTVNIICKTVVGGKVDVCKVTVKKGKIEYKQKQEILTKYEIARKFANKAKSADYKNGALEKYIKELDSIKEDIDTLGSIGEITLIEEKLVKAEKEFNLSSNITINAVKELIERIAGTGSSNNFIIELIKDSDGSDVFEVDFDKKNNKVILRGNNGVSLATAFNYYLKYYCYQNFPVTGPYEIKLPSTLPVVEKPFVNVFPYEYRHYFNENCEYKYTTNNYGEKEWRRRMDWLAMNGFNMYLFDFDERPIWLAAADAGEFGNGFNKSARDEIIKSTGGNFYPDFGNYMISEDSLKKDTEMANKVMKWGYELGLEPEVRPFYGALPFMFPNNRSDYYKNRSAQFKINLPDTIFDGAFAYLAAEWMQMPQGVAISYYVGDNSLPEETKNNMKELYSKVNNIYYKYMQKVFAFDELGRTPKYFIKDLVQEQGFVIKNNAYPREMLRVVDNFAKELNPNRLFIMSSWRVQGWQLDYLDRENTLVIDLRAEGDPRYSTTGQFWGANWVWCMLYNFGGNTGLNSNFRHIATEPLRCHSKYNKMKGVAIAPEGADTDPATYELMAENTWRNEPVDVNDWLNKYLMRRYGKDNYKKAKTEFENVATGLLSTSYSRFAHEGPTQTLINAFPYIQGARARRWGRNDMLYSPEKLVTVWENMIYASQLIDTLPETFKYDLVDFSRQILGDLSKPVYENISKYYKLGDKENTLKYSQMMVDIAMDMDELLSTVDDFTVGKRLAGARNRGATTEDKDYFEKFDRSFLTIWIYGNPAKANGGSGLLDYCNRHLSGLMKDYYGRRWQVLKECIEDAFNQSSVPNINAFESKYNGIMKDKIYQFSNEWVDTPNTIDGYSAVGVGDALSTSNKLFEKYKSVFTEIYGMSFEVKKDNLKSFYEVYSKVEKNNKFDETKWNDFQQKIAEAKAIIDRNDATQMEVNEALSNLKTIYNDMIADANIVDKTSLLAEYNNMKDIEKGDYTDESYSRFVEALSNAKNILDNDNSTQEEVENALLALKNAYGKLEEDEEIIVTVDKSYLNTLVEGYRLISKNDYTSETYLAFKSAYDNSLNVLNDVNATQLDVIDAYDLLLASYNNLCLRTIKKSGCNSVLVSPLVYTLGLSMFVGFLVLRKQKQR